MDILKVSAGSDASATAGALANTIRESGAAELQGIGPKAINQAVKAIAIARSYLASSGVDLVAMPSFVDVEIEGEQRTALRFSIIPRHRLISPHQDGSSDHEAKRESEVGDRSDSEISSGPSVDTDPSAEEDADVVPRRPTSLTEAITGRPASELERSESNESNEADETDTSADVSDDVEDEDDDGDDDRGRRTPFFGRSYRSGVDADRDVS